MIQRCLRDLKSSKIDKMQLNPYSDLYQETPGIIKRLAYIAG